MNAIAAANDPDGGSPCSFSGELVRSLVRCGSTIDATPYRLTLGIPDSYVRDVEAAGPNPVIPTFEALFANPANKAFLLGFIGVLSFAKASSSCIIIS